MNDLFRLCVLTAILTGCGEPGPVVDPNNVDVDGDCPAMCDHWRELGCEEAEPTRAGATCEAVCENNQSGAVAWDIPCMTQIGQCADIDGC